MRHTQCSLFVFSRVRFSSQSRLNTKHTKNLHGTHQSSVDRVDPLLRSVDEIVEMVDSVWLYNSNSNSGQIQQVIGQCKFGGDHELYWQAYRDDVKRCCALGLHVESIRPRDFS